MAHEVEIEQVEAFPIAVVRRRARQDQLSVAIPTACGDVWAYLRARNVRGAGRHVAVYLDDAITFECGVEIAAPFEPGDVFLSATPDGTVAHTAHVGAYDRLGEAHAAIRAWCLAHGRVPAGPNWEIYGHWVEDQAKVRTDVFYLLREEQQAPRGG